MSVNSFYMSSTIQVRDVVLRDVININNFDYVVVNTHNADETHITLELIRVGSHDKLKPPVVYYTAPMWFPLLRLKKNPYYTRGSK